MLRERRGVTLIELLIVVLIMVMITAIAVPVVRPALNGRRQREAARMVDTFINGARNRAALTGRPTGIRIERFAGAPELAMALSYVEVPAPYAGDFVDSTIQIGLNGRVIGFPQGDSAWQGLLRPGDVIQLDYQGSAYRLYNGEPYLDSNANGQHDPGEPYYDTDGSTLYTPNGAPINNTGLNSTGYFQADPSTSVWTLGYDDEIWLASLLSSWSPPPPPQLRPRAPTITPGAYPFRIHRQPVATAAGSLELPESTAIDLVWSGTGTAASISDFSFGPASNLDATPIIITFSPSGAVDKLYQSSLSGTLVGRRPLDPIHLLVGRRDAVISMGPDLVWGASGDDDGDGVTDNFTEAGWPGSDDLPNRPTGNMLDPTSNLENPASLWISINPKSGLVTASPSGTVDVTFASGSYVTPVPVQIFQARRIALESQTMGGR